MRRLSTPDERIGRIAARHHGLVRTAQAHASGLSDRAIEARVRAGRWVRLARGVYRITGAPVSDAQDTYRAVLAAGEGALACGLSALALLGVGSAPRLPHITVSPQSSARTTHALVRRSDVPMLDRTRVGPLPATTPARALLEAAPRVPDEVLRELVDDVVCRGLASPAAILAAIRRANHTRGRAGAPRLRAALEPWLVGITPDSPGEVRLLRRLSDWGFPAPVRQHAVRLATGRRVRLDLAWPDWLAGLEYDGTRSHTPRRLPADVEREEALRSLGWWIGRVDRHDLAPSSTRVRDELRPRLRLLAATCA